MNSEIFERYKGPILIIIASIFFSTTGTSQALAPEGATPQVIGGLRMVVGFIALFFWCLFSNRLPKLKNWPPGVALLSALGTLGYQMFFFAAAKATGVAVSAVVATGFIPIITGVLGFFVLQEKPKRIWYLATLIAVVGLILLSLTPDMQAKPIGLLFAILAAFGYSVYAVFGKKLVMNNDPATVIMVLFGIAAILVSPVFFIFPVAWIFTTHGIVVTLHLGLIATALGYTTYMAGLKLTPASTCATLNLSEALIAACWGVFLLGEYLGPLHWVGMAFIFGAVTMLTLKSK